MTDSPRSADLGKEAQRSSELLKGAIRDVAAKEGRTEADVREEARIFTNYSKSAWCNLESETHEPGVYRPGRRARDRIITYFELHDVPDRAKELDEAFLAEHEYQRAKRFDNPWFRVVEEEDT